MLILLIRKNFKRKKKTDVREDKLPVQRQGQRHIKHYDSKTVTRLKMY